ncbi:glycosyltransferase [Sphingomonas ginsenosidivorax]|uniref:Glycosyltransferase n=1 Tax=Sphingomonas ginsenosidivorax TaxID=862135 RepID=A0A5C6UEL2_9SPHN|nr:glycosyltransferase [Sphingomonas ginsenosidivorax]
MTTRSHAPQRAVAVAIPVKNEDGHLLACLHALDRAACRYAGRVTILAMANDCHDGSLGILQNWRPRHALLDWRAVSMLPGARHAGWARRLALDAAAGTLVDDGDLLLSTDADTYVAPDWIARIAAYVDAGYDAVAGRALTLREDRAALGLTGRYRLNQLGRYYTALDYLRATTEAEAHDPWPRHFYEGGASIALTLALYRRIGGAPTPQVAEDRALFDRIRAHRGRVRHPLDVRVFTSCRIEGRAPGGMADAVAGWITQPADAPLHEVYTMAAALSPGDARPGDQISFLTLPAAIAEAKAAIRRLSQPPEIEPIRLMPIAALDGHPVFERSPEFGDGIVPALGIVGLADPVDQKHMAA